MRTSDRRKMPKQDAKAVTHSRLLFVRMREREGDLVGDNRAENPFIIRQQFYLPHIATSAQQNISPPFPLNWRHPEEQEAYMSNSLIFLFI